MVHELAKTPRKVMILQFFERIITTNQDLGSLRFRVVEIQGRRDSGLSLKFEVVKFRGL